MRAFRTILAALGLVLVAAAVWGVAIEPRLIAQTRHTVSIPGLPATWENREIILLADLQVGMWLGNTGTVERMAARIVELRPGAVLFAGDFIYNPVESDERDERDEYEDVDESIREVMQVLKPVSDAGIPFYAVLGNHDYGMMQAASHRNDLVAGRLEKAAAAAGIRVLHNQVVEVAGLYLAGIGSKYAGDSNPEAALAQVPAGAPRIVFMHHPDSFPDLPSGAAPLALAAHTHGGQIRIPGLPSWSWLTLLEPGKVPADGWIENYGAADNRLYVTRGVGFSRVPVRINCRPELAVFTLRAAGR